jgi:hypothetical protein
VRALGLVGWGVVGAAFVLGFLAAPSFGLVTLPVAVVAAFLLVRRGATAGWMGTLVGAGVVLLVVGLVQDDVPDCDEPASFAPTSDTRVCSEGGIPAEAFLVAGGVAVLAGAALSAFARR